MFCVSSRKTMQSYYFLNARLPTFTEPYRPLLKNKPISQCERPFLNANGEKGKNTDYYSASCKKLVTEQQFRVLGAKKCKNICVYRNFYVPLQSKTVQIGTVPKCIIFYIYRIYIVWHVQLEKSVNLTFTTLSYVESTSNESSSNPKTMMR